MKNAYRFLLFSILFASLAWQGCHCNDRQNEVTISGNSNPQAVSVPSHSQININAQTVPDGYNLEALRDILRYEKFSGQIDRDYLQNLLNRPEVNNLDVNSDGQKDFVYPILYDQDGVKGFTINLPNPNAPDQPLEIAAVTFKSVGGQHSMYVDGKATTTPNMYTIMTPLGASWLGIFGPRIGVTDMIHSIGAHSMLILMLVSITGMTVG